LVIGAVGHLIADVHRPENGCGGRHVGETALAEVADVELDVGSLDPD